MMWLHNAASLLPLIAFLLPPSATATLRGGVDRSFHKQKDPAFEPAMPLDFFRSLDPNEFEWVNAAEINPGEATCGFLKAPLGALPHVNYPTVKVYVCVKFASIQPAPKGNLAVHCGGPSSLSICAYIMGGEEYLGADNVDQYNVISFDQRGMGRSEPTFVVDECDVSTYDTQLARYLVNLNDEESIREDAQVFKARALGCWAYEGFQLKSKTRSGMEKTYHFLEYSGTRQLAEDIERIRKIFGNQKLSVYGVSYGTKVMGAYATVYPNHVNLMVLDGNDDPNTDIVQNAIDFARSGNQRIDYFISSCDMNPQSCPVDNMRRCFNELNKLIQANAEDIEATFSISNPSNLMSALINALYASFDDAPTFCDAAVDGDYALVRELLLRDDSERMLNRGNAIPSLQTGQLPPFDSESRPTSGQSNVWPFANYTMKNVAADLVTAMDYAFGAYDEDTYVKFLMDLNKQYPGAGTQIPAIRAKQWYSACYFWPNVAPLAPIGNPQITGIVAGQLYDPNTPYIWTQKMRENFKLTNLLTSRSVNHGLTSAEEVSILDPECIVNVHHYFKTGIVNFPDGTVCESDPIGQACSIDQVMMGKSCDGMADNANEETRVSVA